MGNSESARMHFIRIKVKFALNGKYIHFWELVFAMHCIFD